MYIHKILCANVEALMMKKYKLIIAMLLVVCAMSLTLYGCNDDGEANSYLINENMTQAEIVAAIKDVDSFTLEYVYEMYDWNDLVTRVTSTQCFTSKGYSFYDEQTSIENGKEKSMLEYYATIIDGDKYYELAYSKDYNGVPSTNITSDYVSQLAESPSDFLREMLDEIEFDEVDAVRVINGKLILEKTDVDEKISYTYSNFNNTQINILSQFSNYKELAQ